MRLSDYLHLFVVLLLLSACEEQPKREANSDSPQPTEYLVETDEGTIVAESTVLEPGSQKVESVHQRDIKQFEKWANDAKDLLSVYGPSNAENELVRYDDAFKAWQLSADKQHTDQEIINLLGAYLGHRMIQDFGMEWVFVVDEFGEDFAVRHKKYSLMGFPFSSVMKRVESGELSFMHSVYHVLKNELETGDLGEHIDGEELEDPGQ